MPDFYRVKYLFSSNLTGILLAVFTLLSLSAAGQTLVAPANPTNNLCIGVQQTLSDIQIAETSVGDFGASGSNMTFVLVPPANFQFVPGSGGAVSTANELTIVSYTALAVSTTVTVANPTASALDIITISGLQIEAIAPASSGNILRPAGAAGGTLVVAGQANSGSGTSYGFVSSIEQPAIVSSPSSAVRCAGTSVSFTGSASGAGITYQWEEDQGSGFSSVTNGGQYSGATTGTLTISALTTAQTGYVYRLVASGTCAPPATSATATLTVNANPTAGLSSDAPSNTICAGTTVTFTASGGSNYQFFLDGISVQNSASATYVNAALTNGQTVTVTVTNAAGCTASSSGIATTVNPVPVASLVSSDADNIICSGTSVVFTATPAATNYEFKKNGVTVQNSASSTYTDAVLINGDVLQVLVTSAAGCIGTSGTITTTVNPNPVLSSTLTPADICSGTLFSYSATSATGGATFLWTRSAVLGIAEGASSAASANISETLTNTTALPVSVVYRFITSASSCSTAENVTVVVNPTPSLSSGLSPAAVCSGSAFNYSATSVTPGATFSWNRATIAGITPVGPTSGTNTIAETLSNSTAAPIAVTYAFTTSANGCSQVQNVVVNVNPQPALSSSLSPTGICSGTSFSYAPTSATAGTTFAWTRAVVGGISQGAGSGTGAISEVLTNTTTAPVNVTYIYTLTANGCTNPSTFSVVVPVNPTPQLSSALSAALCNGSAFSYTATSATAGASFSWTRAVVGGISNSAGSGLLPTINETLNNITTSPISVTYAFVVSANGCNNAQNVVVSVNPIPVLSSTLSPAAICSGSTFNYTGTSATPAATLSWSRATVAGITPIGPTSGFTSISEALTNTTASPIVVTYAFVTSANGCNSGQNVLVTVQPDPVLTSTLTPAAICSGTLFAYTPASSTAGATFAWSRSVVAGISQGAASGTGAVSEILTNTTASPVSVTYVYSVSANGCSNPTTANVVVVVNPTPALSSSLAVSTCSATTFNYAATSGTAGVSFSWSRAVVAGISEAASSGLTGTIAETLTNLTNTPLVVAYSFVISANGCNNAENVLVTVNPTPVLSSTTSPAAICSGATFSYTATSAVGGVSYSWTRSAVAGISEAGSSGLVAGINETLTNTTSSPVVVTYAFVLSANGCANGQNVTVTVQPVPVVNVVSNQTLCNGASTTAVSFSGVATQYNWTNDTPSIGLAASGVGNIPSFTSLNPTTNPVTATITITPVYNGCTGTTKSFTITVDPTPVLTSTLTPSAICSGTSFSYTPTSATGGTTYAWTRAAVVGISQAAGSGTGVINETLTNTTVLPLSVVYNIVSTANGCSNGGQNVVVTVYPTPLLSSTLTATAICSGSTFGYTPTSATTGTTFAWTRAAVGGISPATGSGTGNISEALSSSNATPTVVTYVVVSTANGCSNTGENVTVTVQPVPVVNVVSNQTLCNGASTTAVSFSGVATQYNWTNDTPSIGLAASGVGNIPSFTSLNPTTNPVTATITITPVYNGCTGTTKSFTITVDPTPVLTSTLTPSAICSGTSFSYTPTSATGGTTYAWTRAAVVGISQAAGSGTGVINETLTNTTVLPLSVVYNIVSTANGCSNGGQNVVVTVYPTPLLSSTLTATAICSGATFGYTPTSATTGTTFAWTRAAVGGISPATGSGTGNISEALSSSNATPTVVTYVVVSTANGCSNTGENVTVTVQPVPVVNVVSNQTLCNGASTTAVSFSGVATQYNWTNDTPSIGLAASGVGNIPSFTSLNPTTNPVTATITITPVYNGCTGTTTTFTITVNPTPVLTSTLTPSAICSGTSFSYTPTSATGGTTYAWTRAAVVGISQAAGSGTGVINETLTNTTVLPLSVVYNIVSTANGCSNGGQNVVVTVYPTPLLSSTLTATAICSGATFGYTPTSATTGTTFAWTRAAVGGISPATGSGTGNISEALSSSNATPTVVTYVVVSTANGCSNTGENVTVTVQPVPVVNVVSNQTLCNGASTTAVSFSGVATQYNWTNDTPSIGLAASGVGNIPSFTSLNPTTNPVTATITITPVYNGCTGTTTTFTITVNPTPVLTSTLTPSAICSGTSFSYTPTSATGGTTYAWTRASVVGISQAAGSGTGVINETLTNTTVLPLSVVYNIVSTANGCSNGGQNVVVTVYPTPLLSSTLTATAICSGATFGYTPTSATTGTTFAWTRAAVGGISPATGSGTGNISEALSSSNATPTVVTYVVVSTANGCSNTGENVTVTVQPVPVVNVVSNQTLCSGASTTAVSFSGVATQYNWTNDTPSIGLAASGVGNIPSFTSLNPTTNPVTATITITPVYNGCTGTTTTFTITVNPTPVLTSTLTPSAICSGTSFSYTPTSATGGTTYAWTRAAVVGISQAAGSGTGVINETLTNTTVLPLSVVYNIVSTANGCSNGGQNVVVTVYPTPLLSSTLTATAICSGATFGYTPTSATTGTTFAWTRAAVGGISPATGSGTGNISEALSSSNATPTVVTYVVVSTANGCSNTGENVTVTVQPVPVVNVVSNQTLCNGASTTAVSFSGVATQYNWTNDTPSIGLAASGVGNIPSFTSLNPTTNPVTATITITPVYNGCTGTTTTFTITVNPTPVLTSTLTPSAICSGTSFSYTPTSATGGTTYAWTRAAVVGISQAAGSGTGVINETLTNTTVLPLSVVYNIVSTANGCSNGGQNVVVTVYPTPLLSSTLTATAICSGATFGYTPTSATTGTTFAWTRAAVGGISPATGSGTGNISEALSSSNATPTVVTYVVVSTANGCSNTGENVTVTVQPVPVVNVVSNQTLCNGASTTAVSFSGVATQYNWTNDTPSIGLAASGVGNIPSFTSLNPTTNPVTATITITPVYNGCTGTTTTFTITVNPTPVLTSTLTPSAICSGTSFSYTPTSATGGTTYAWTRAAVVGISQAAGSGTGVINETLTNTTVLPLSVVYNIVSTANGCSNGGQNVVVTVYPTPLLSSTLTATAICSGATFGYTPTSATTGTTFAWTRAAVGGISPATGSGTGNISEALSSSNATPTVVTYVVVSTANGCSNTGENVTVTVQPVPVVNVVSNQTLCNGASTTAVSFSGVATQYNWTNDTPSIGLAASGVGNIPSFTSLNPTTNPVTATITITPVYNGCTGTTTTFTITVNPTPVLTSTLTPSAICSGTSFSYTPTSATGGTTYAWTRAAVVGISQAAGSGTGVINETLTNTTVLPLSVVYNIVSTANGCSNGGQNVVVTVYPTPLLSSTLTATAICSGATFGYTPTSATTGTTFAWTRAAVGGISPATGSGTGNISEALSSSNATPTVVTYVVVSTANGCSNTGENVTVTVQPVPVVNVVSNQTLCNGASTTAVSFSGVATQYNWTNDTPSIGLAASGVGNIPSFTSLNPTTNPVTATITITPVYNGCTGTTTTFTITVNPTPVLTSTLTPSAICSGTSFSYTPTSATGGTTYAWTRAAVVGISQAAGSGTGVINETLTNTTVLPLSVVYNIVSTANGCSNGGQNVVVTVYPTPLLSSTLTATAICSGATFGYTPTSATTGTTFAWTRAAVGGISPATGSGTGNISEALSSSNATPTVVTYVVVSTANGCSNTGENVTVTVQPVPVVNVVSNQTLCNGASTTAVSFSGVATQYNWTNDTPSIGLAASGVGNIPSFTSLNPTTNPVTATITITPVYNGCTGTTTTFTITVNPTPVLTSTLTPSAICSGTSFSYTPTSATGGTTYAWTRAAVVGISQAAGSGTGVINETLTNTTVLPLSVVYNIVSTANGCSNGGQNVVVTVYPTPLLSSTLTATAICSGATFGYTPTSATTGTTFAWTRAAVGGISPATGSGTGNISEALSSSNATPTVVTYVVVSTANGCSNTGENVTVTVQPVPVVNVVSNQTLCNGASTTAVSFSGVATQYNWTNDTPSIGLAASGVGNIPSFTSLNPTTNPVTATITITPVYNGCTGTTTTFTITVNPTPVLTSTLTPSAICSGTSFSYTPTSATGGTTYAWTRASVVGISQAAGSGTGVINETLTNTTVLPLSVVYNIVSTANGCSNGGQNVVVTVYPTPLLSSTLTATAICSGATFGYTPTSATTGTTFAWTRAAVGGISPATGSGTGNISEALSSSNATPTVVTYVVVSTANGCSNTGENVTVTVQPVPVVNVVSNQTLCNGASTTAVSFSGVATQYNWTNDTPSIGLAASGVGNIPSFTSLNPTTNPVTATITITPVYNGCTGTTTTFTITVNPTPVLTSTLTPSAICSGTSFSYTPTSATGGTTYAWTRASVVGISQAAGSGTGVINETLTNTTVLPLSVVYNIVSTANGCSNGGQNVVVTVYPTPLLSSTLTATAICSGATFGYTPTSATTGTTFAWTRAAVGGISPATGSGTGNISEALSSSNATPTVVTYVVVSTANGCSNTGENVTVTVQPVPVVNVVSNQTLCNGASTTAVSFSGVATQYNWTNDTPSIGLAASGVGNIPSFTSLNPTTNPVTATITITPVYNGCTGTTKSLTITVNPIPVLVQQANIISCPGAVQPTINFTTNVDPVTSYSWSVTNSAALGLASGAGVTGNIPGWTFAANNTGTDIPGIATVTATKGGCTSAPMTFGISVRAQPVLTNPGNQVYCPGVPVTINWASNAPGSIITWSNSNPAIGISAGPNNGDISFTTAPNFTGANVVGTITATATRNGCTSVLQSFTITVSPIPVLTQQANITACPGTNQSAINFVTNADPVTSYNWTVTNSALLGMGSGSGTGSSIPAWTFAANNTGADIIGVATVTATKAGCTSSVMTFNITLSAQPVLTAQSNVTYCPGAPVNINFVSNVPGSQISWSNANTVIGIGVSGNGNLSFTAPANLTSSPIVSTVDVNAIHSGCVSPTMSFVITINPSPQFTITNNTPIICEGTAADITLNSVTTGAVMTLTAVNYNGATGTPLLAGATFTDGQKITETLGNPTNLPINVVYTFSVSANGCNNPFTQTATITVKPMPSATASSATICSGQNDFILITAGPENVSGTTFDWTYTASANVIGAASGNGSTINQNLSLSNFVPGSVQYTITPTANGCVGPQTIATITVNPIPIVNAGSDFQVCEPATIALSGTIGGAATSGNWVLVSGGGILSASTTSGTLVTATYTVNPGDVTNTLTFRLISNDPDGAGPCSAASALLHVTVNRSATVSLPANYTICEPVSFAASPINLTGTIGGSAISGLWSVISGAGGLSATNVSGTTVSANYVISPSDVGSTLTFRLTSNDPDGLGPCTPVFKDINIHINQRAVVSAGIDLSLCQNIPSIALQGSFGGSTSAVTWSGGAGAFGNNLLATSTYSFVPAEVNTTIVLTLTAADPDGAGPCSAVSDQMNLTINKLPTVVFFGLPSTMAENNSPITLSGNQVGGLFTISPLTSNIGSTSPTPTGNAVFNPGAATLGLNQITYTYSDPTTTCTNSQTQPVIINPVTNVDFSVSGAKINASNEFELCNYQTAPVRINGFPSPTTGLAPTGFSASVGQTFGAALPLTINSGEYYIDTHAPSDTYLITYTYKNSVGATDTLTRVLKLLSIPNAVISVANSCIKDAIQFADGATVMPPSPFPVTIGSWSWDFNENGTGSAFATTSHTYSNAGVYNVKLTVTTLDGCSAQATKPIRVGDVPVVDFNWSAICNNDSTKFVDKTNPGTVSHVDTYTWDFGDGDVLTGTAAGSVPPGANGGRTSGSYKKPNHKYTSFGTYTTKLTVITDDLCNNSQTQKVFILPYSTVTPLAGSAYQEGFELSNGGWIAEAKQPSDTSWIWGPPTGSHINVAAAGTKVWWTGGNANSYFANEQSAVNGPCFDLRNLIRPMISLDIWSDSEHNLDGAVLQYSTDGGVNWRIVGPPEGQLSRDEGINWFDGQGIPSNPGLQPIGNYGWTDPTNGWRNARFNLDMIPKIDRDQVRIRIAYGSNSTNPPGVQLDGFAFDNVFVGDKARNVLVEHFTNSSLKASTDADAQIDKLFLDQFTVHDSTDFNYVQYHIGFPGADPLNADNPTDPASRSLFYGVSQPPATIMDGILDGVKFKGSYNDLSRVEIDRRALKDPLFDLILTEYPASTNNMISVGLDIVAKQNFNAPLIAQVLLVEKQTGTFKNVLRKQLFGADGQTISNNFVKGGPPFSHQRNNVVIDVPITNPGRLTLVAYVQDKNTKEIYQSIIRPASNKQGAPVTGIEPVVTPTALNGITLYPNPASGSFSLLLPEGKTAEGFSWKLIDQRGVILKSGDFDDLIDQTRTVDISSLANGIYIVAIAGPGKSVVYQKLVILNRN